MERIIYGGGDQPVRFIPHDLHGNPVVVGTADWVILDLRESEESAERTVASGTATQDITNASTISAAGPTQADRYNLVVSTTNMTAGFDYLLTDQNGYSETFRAKMILSSVVVRAEHPISRDYSNGATVRGLVCEATFPGTEADDEDNLDINGGPYEVRWTYTHNGVVYSRSQSVFIRRTDPDPMISEQFLLDACPTIADRIGERVTARQAINVATLDFIADIESRGLDPAQLRGGHAAQVAVRERALAWIYAHFPGDTNDAARERHADRYTTLIGSLTTGRMPDKAHVVDPDADTAKMKVVGRPIFRRS